MRRGAKENIADATWKEDKKSETNEDVLDSRVTGSTNIESATSVALNDSDVYALQFVPRKRTNANHVITPRKPQSLRQTTLNALAQTQAFTESQLSSEKSVRRRKSARKSIRKSVAGGIADVPVLPLQMKINGCRIDDRNSPYTRSRDDSENGTHHRRLQIRITSCGHRGRSRRTYAERQTPTKSSICRIMKSLPINNRSNL